MTGVLCVDNNDNNIFMIKTVLQRAGVEVIVAADSEGAVTAAKLERSDLILMDLVLPGIDGLEATQQIKAAPDTSAIPVIAVSAQEESAKGAAARDAGCDDYAPKPLDLRKLLEQTQGLIADRTAGPEPAAASSSTR